MDFGFTRIVHASALETDYTLMTIRTILYYYIKLYRSGVLHDVYVSYRQTPVLQGGLRCGELVPTAASRIPANVQCSEYMYESRAKK